MTVPDSSQRTTDERNVLRVLGIEDGDIDAILDEPDCRPYVDRVMEVIYAAVSQFRRELDLDDDGIPTDFMPSEDGYARQRAWEAGNRG